MSQLSYAAGPTDHPLLSTTIGASLEQAAKRWANELALVSRHQGIRWTWAEFNGEVDRIAAGLLRHGIKPGDRVAIWSPNCAEWAVTQFATAKIGAILVTINPAYRLVEVEYALNKVGCSALITAPSFKSSDYVGILRELGAARLPDMRLMVTLGQDPQAGFVRWDDLRADPDPDQLNAIAAKLDQHDPINIQFTSGTTGYPKGATLTHHNIVNNGMFAARTMHITAADRICIPVPLYHCFGMVLGNLAALSSGATMVYPDQAFDAAKTLDAIAQEGCTAPYGVPTMFIAILERLATNPVDVSSLRTGMMAGSPCPIATMQAVIDKLNMTQVTIGYGMTETSPLTAQTAINDPIDKRTGTVGRVHPHAEAKIIGNDGETLPRGEQGEYCSRGYAIMSGYWGDDDRTREAIDSDGWMHSGDLAVMDDECFIKITGRIKDMIIRGGENIYPREIEELLVTHPDITDAQVFGVSDDRYGEEVCALVIVREGTDISEEDIRLFCERRIAHFKVPRYVRIVDDFIMTVTGKPQKFEMRKWVESELGL